MRKGILVFLLACGVTFYFLAAGASPAHLEGPIKLSYSNFFSPTHIQSKLAKAWCEEVEKRSGGRVKIDYYPGQTLTKSKQIYDGAVQGLSDIGFCLFGYTRGRFPQMEVVDLPLGYPSGQVATRVVNAVAAKFRPKELSDVKVMYLHAHGPGLLHTRGRAVRTMADLKGLKIRAHGFSAKVVKALGGTPVAMPMPETYQSLQKGVVDGSLYPMEANKGWKLAEVTDFATLNYSMAYTTSFYVVMNKDKWAALPEDIKKIIDQINQEWIPKHGRAWDASDDEGRKFFKSKGNQLISLTPAESEAWKKATQSVLQEYVKMTKAKGLPGAEALEYTRKVLAEASK